MDTIKDTDLLLIGAGPSNIALAVALEELGNPPDVAKILMLEAGRSVGWHPGMMFAEAQSQVSFLKDLVTLRNPTSTFTFLNFLHQTKRLNDFVNLQTFFPYRREISDYLRWCVSLLQGLELHCESEVAAIEPMLDSAGRVQRWLISARGKSRFTARRVVYGGGRQLQVPEPFRSLDTPRVLHASRFLGGIEGLDPASIGSVAVIGGAQSSAEVFHECAQRFPDAHVHLLMRSVGLRPYGGSKFTNALYGTDFVDSFFEAPEQARRQMLQEMRDSNYAGVTPSMLEVLFRQQYLQRLNKSERIRIHTQCRVTQARLDADRVRLSWAEGPGAASRSASFDLVLLGTGYRNEMPAMLLRAVQPLGMRSIAVNRNYRAAIPCADCVSLHVLGVNETTHGISDTLLSVVGARAQRVREDMLSDHRRGRPMAHSGSTAPPVAPSSSAAMTP